MRLDRLITLGFVRPMRRAARKLSAPFSAAGESGLPLPVLMYHSISDDPEPHFSPYYKVNTSPARFALQMQWLADAGWQGVTLRHGLAELARSTAQVADREAPQSARKLVAITFDDGFRDFAVSAFPALQRHGFSATMYLPTGFIGSERRAFNSRECLTWSEVKHMADAGIEFGSHTVRHPKLVELAWPDIETELAESKATIEDRGGFGVDSFAYPYAFPQHDAAFVDRLIQVLRATGYRNCATTQIGRVHSGDNPFQLRRLPVNDLDDESLLIAKLEGAYDWLARPQRLAKRLKRSSVSAN